ncbi:MAG: hypothetical protein QM820_20205 [Minicystis sp.]
MSTEPVGIRIYFHAGWAIQVDTTFEHEMLYEGETLRMFDPGDRHEVYLSSLTYQRTDGAPLTAEHILDVYPPKEMTGLRYEHRNGDVAGAALWFLGEDDEHPKPSWVLMAVMVCPPAGRFARCTIVCDEETDRDWALDVWRSIVRRPPPPREGLG